MVSRIGVALPLLLLAVVPAAASAQQRTQLAFETTQSELVAAAVAQPTAPVQEREEMRPEEIMGTSGFFLSIVSMMGGAAIASGTASCPPRAEDRECSTRRAVVGALIAGTVAAPIGVHIAAKEPKNLAKSLGLSAVAGGALYLIFDALPGSPTAIAPFLSMPVQVFTAVRLEK